MLGGRCEIYLTKRANALVLLFLVCVYKYIYIYISIYIWKSDFAKRFWPRNGVRQSSEFDEVLPTFGHDLGPPPGESGPPGGVEGVASGSAIAPGCSREVERRTTRGAEDPEEELCQEATTILEKHRADIKGVAPTGRTTSDQH